MTTDYLLEYLRVEKRLRGVCVREDPEIQKTILKSYIFPEKYMRKPLWCISSENLNTIGIVLIESCRGIYGDLEISHYEWTISEFHPIKPFHSPFKSPKKAPTHSFECPVQLNEELFQKISSFKSFLNS